MSRTGFGKRRSADDDPGTAVKGQMDSHSSLLAELRQLIDSARQRVAMTVNAELTLLYWQIGRRIHAEVLQGQRAEYGKQIIITLAQQLTADYGKGWSEKQLRHCLRVAEIFSDEAILSALRRELSWTHIKALIYVEDPLKQWPEEQVLMFGRTVPIPFIPVSSLFKKRFNKDEGDKKKGRRRLSDSGNRKSLCLAAESAELMASFRGLL